MRKSHRMKHRMQIALSILLFALCVTTAVAKNKDIDTAMGLYRTMDINKAANHAILNINDIESLTSIEKLKFALILNKNFSMYRDIYQKSLDTQQIFLESLTAQNTDTKSLFAPLFLSEIYILKGELKKAKKQLSQFKKNSKNSSDSVLEIIYTLWLDSSQNNKKLKLNNTDPLIAMAIDAVNIATTGKSSIDSNIIKRAEQQYLNKQNINKIRFSNYAIRIYSQQGKLNDAKRVFLTLDQKSPSFVEEISQFKLINFYEPSLIDSVSLYYYKLSQQLLTELKKDKKYHDMAVYYLSDLELIIANKKTAEHFKQDMLTLKRLPASLSALRDIRQNGHAYLFGDTTRAHQIWQKAVNNTKNNPTVGAEAILMCLYLKANCPTIVQIAQLKAENGRSKRFENINTNVGRYFLLKKENNKALRLLENALDRGNADGLLMNEPILLLNLAEIYRLEKRFSESLQIYFSLGKNFPALRQVQNAVQGEYLLRQRSNGSNNLF